MPYLYLLFSVLFCASASIFGSLFNRKNDCRKDGSAIYNFILLIATVVGWGVLFACDFSFDMAVLPYSLLFAVCYAATNIGIINALRSGPVAQTSLIVQLSLIGTTVWGFIFWGAPLTPVVAVGIALVIAAICLCLYEKKGDDGQKLSLRWLVFVLMAFCGNAGCTIVQRTQQNAFGGRHGSMLMLFAMIFSSLAGLFYYLKSNKSDSRAIVRGSWYLPVAAGLCNVLLNLFVILLAGTSLSPGLIYPVIGVGSIMVTTLFSVLIVKERLTAPQWVGIALGAAAVALLSL